MRSVAVLVALAVTAVTAQVPKYNSSLDMTIDPNTVPQQQRAVWCQAQTNTCQLLCHSNTNDNSCNQATLDYACTCSSNSSAPALQYYHQTMPTFICEMLFSQCISQNAGSQSAQADCTKNIQDICGTIDPPTAKDASETTSAAPTSAAATTAATHPAQTAEATSAATTTEAHNNWAGRTEPLTRLDILLCGGAALLAWLL